MLNWENMSSWASSNSEASVSELLEALEETFLISYISEWVKDKCIINIMLGQSPVSKGLSSPIRFVTMSVNICHRYKRPFRRGGGGDLDFLIACDQQNRFVYKLIQMTQREKTHTHTRRQTYRHTRRHTHMTYKGLLYVVYMIWISFLHTLLDMFCNYI